MSATNKPRQDDQDNDGIPDDMQRDTQAKFEQDMDGEITSDRETLAKSNPIIINQ